MAPDDPLGHAEAQMIQHELEAFRELQKRILRRLEVPLDEKVGEERFERALLELIREDPEARELAHQVADFIQFRQSREEA